MKLAAFFSGGKDSCYAIYKAKQLGHTIEVLITIIPQSDDSHLLHFHNISKKVTKVTEKTQFLISPNTDFLKTQWLL